MEKESKEFLFNLLTTPSPTGYEQKIQKVVRTRMKRFADEIEADLHGNLFVTINPKAQRRVMLAGHCDQIGMVIKHISKEGYLYVLPLGGMDVGVLPGSHVTVWGENGPVRGIVGRKPIHHQSSEERDRMKLDIDKIWIDIGAKNEKEARKRVNLGDPITYLLGVTELGNDLIVSPGLDDRVGLFVAMEALRLCSKKKLNVSLTAVSTVQEEVGLRGAQTAAYAVDPEVGIAIDVIFATDNPGSDNPRAMPCKLGEGPSISCGPNTNPIVEKMLHAAAKKAKIPSQRDVSGRPLGNDSNAIQVTRGGVATAAIGIPNRYMHTQVEVCHLKDLENSAILLAEFVASITAKTDFRPAA